MGINWLDIILVANVAVAVTLGFRRGFGRVMFDFVAFLAAARLAYFAYIPVAEATKFLPGNHANHAYCFGMLFISFAMLFWLLGKLAYDTTLFSLDTFDPPLGAILGIGVAIIISHAFTTTTFLATEKKGYSQVVQESTLAPEFQSFTTYRNVVDTIKRMGE